MGASYKGWIIWFCASLFYGYQYILRVIPSVLKNELINHFSFDTFLFGQFAGIYYLGYTLAHIPLGILLDKYGPKYILPFSIFLSFLGMLPVVFGHNWLLGIVGRFILGIGSSCAFIGLVKIVQLFFDKENFNSVLSYGAIFGLIGAVFSGAPIVYLMDFFNWKSIILLFIFLGVCLCFVLFMLLPETKQGNKEGNLLLNLKSVFQNKWILLIALGGGLMVGPIEGYADAWASESLEILYGFSKYGSSQSVSLIYFGFACGLAVLSFMSKYIGTLRVIILSGIMMALSFLCILSAFLPAAGVVIGLFILGFFSAYQVSALYQSTLFAKSNQAGFTTSFVNTIFMLFGIFFHSFIAGGIQFFAFDMEKPSIGLQYSQDIYQKGLMVIPLALLFGTIIFFYVGRTKNKN